MSYLTRAMGKPRFERIFRKMGKLPPQGGAAYERQGTAYDPHAVGYEKQGRASEPELTAAAVLDLVDDMKADFMSWKALAAKALAPDEVPNKKADIIKALEAKIEAEKGA